MGKRIIECAVNNEYVIGGGVPIGAEGSHDDVVLRVAFSEMWTGLNIYATFINALGEEPTVVILTASMLAPGEAMTYDIPIPAAAKREEGRCTFSLTGYVVTNGTEGQATNTATTYFRVLPSKVAILDDGTVDITLAQQLQDEVNRHEQAVAEQMSALFNAIDGAIETAGSAVEAAEEAVRVAGSAAGTANEAKGASENAVVIANEAKSASDDAAAVAKSADNVVRDLEHRMNSGEFKGEKGDPFMVSKVYPSVADMEADFSNTAIKEGAFVVIETGNVDDEENARLYIKGADEFYFVTDLSGAQGMKGPQGPEGKQGPRGDTGPKGDSYVLTDADRDEIYNRVMAGLPTWEGGSY
jgi:hypothetical protein